MDIKVVRKNKSYDKRYLKIYFDKKLMAIARPWGGWFSWDKKFDDVLTRGICRYKVLENLHWLVGKDCDDFTWSMQINKWDSGTGINGKTEKYSQFFNIDEKLTALQSFGK